MSGAACDAKLSAELRVVAERAAIAGGKLARDAFRQPGGIRLKDDQSFVTDADIAAQEVVVAAIAAERPQDAWIGEESPFDAAAIGRSAADGIVWLIDPIDGTRNFVRGIQEFACSVGAMWRGMPVAGAIYNPMAELLYSGDSASGCFVNGTRLEKDAGENRAGPPDELLVGIPSMRHRQVAPLTQKWVDRYVVRSLGSTALHLALVATSELDAALSATCKLWDIAAGAALILSRGGAMTSLDGEPIFPLDLGCYACGDLPCIAARSADVLGRLAV